MKFENLIAYPIWPDTVHVQWVVDNLQLSGDYKFVVKLYHGDSIIHQSPILYNSYEYNVLHVHLLHKEIRNQFMISVKCTPPKIDPKHGVDIFEEIIDMYHGLNRREYCIANEIIRKENLRFSEKIGLKLKILKRKLFGTACTHCLDKLTNTITNSNCPICFGTKIEGGFFNPVEVWGEIVEEPVQKQITQIGTVEEKTSMIRLDNTVMVSKKDIIVDIINNDRWLTTSEPHIIKYRSFPISQQFSVTMVSPKSIINRINI